MEKAGAQHVLLAQAAWFHEQGNDVKAVFVYDKQGLEARWQDEHPFPVLSLNGWRYKGFFLANFFRLLGAIWKLTTLLRKADVVIAFTSHSNLLGLPLAFLAGTPVRIGTHHGYIEGSPRFLQKLHGWLTNSRLCSIMVCVSKQVRLQAMQTEGARAEKLLVIENGIQPAAMSSPDAGERVRAELGVEAGQKLLLTVGRLVKQKGHAVLLAAIPAMQDQQAKFVWAGEGPLRPSLEQQARQLGVAERVTFAGVRNDVADLLGAADVFVQPSLWEGLSIALLEAMFAEVPVVATRVEGVVDAVEDGHSALLVPPNDPGALAAALDRILADPQLAGELAAAGKRIAESKYTVEAMCGAYQQLIQDLSHG